MKRRSFLKLSAAAALAGACTPRRPLSPGPPGAEADILIVGGRVCDGTGREPFEADVAIRAGRIVRVVRAGDPRAPSADIRAGGRARIIDAAGRIVAPGFIDLHSHGDLVLPLPGPARARLVEGRIRQGITTEIVGNCGLGPVPATEASAPIAAGILSWMTPDGGAAVWPDIASYLDRLETAGVPVNVGTLVAQGAIRLAAIGLRGGRAGPAERRAMAAAIARALEEGAFGLSAGLIYPPGMYTDTDELAALARPVASADRLFTCHVRGSSELLFDSVEELVAIGERTGARVHHSHNEAVGRRHWWKVERVLDREEAARRAGVRLSYDMFPYTVAATMMIAIYPPWSLEGGVAALLDRLRDASARQRIRRDVEHAVPEWPPWREGGWPHNLVSAVGWDGIAVSRVANEAGRRYVGMTLAELARARGTDPFDAISDLMLEQRGEVGQWVFEISGADDDDEALMRLATDPAGAFCTDANDPGRGLPHPASWGAFPRVLGRLVRERGRLSIGEAVRKMTSYPAALLGLSDRGRIAPGLWADIVILDPARVGDRATLSEPRRPPSGIDTVMVNGVAVVDEGRLLPATPGHVLRAV